jgi:hypothetical protein
MPALSKSSAVKLSMAGSRSALLDAYLLRVLLRLDTLFRAEASAFLGVLGRSEEGLETSSSFEGVG